MSGTFIALEGDESSNVTTYAQLVFDRLKVAGYETELYAFPRIRHPSGFYVSQYLSGSFGGPDTVDAHTAAIFYSLDHYHAAQDIQEAMSSGKVVIATNYTGSVMAGQGSKFANSEKRRGFFIWVDNFEFQLLHVPRPAISVVLSPPATSHTPQPKTEASRLAAESFDDICTLFPKDFWRPDSLSGNSQPSDDQIASEIFQKIVSLQPLPESASSAVKDMGDSERTAGIAEAIATLDYFVPLKLPQPLQNEYALHMDAIFELYARMVDTLTTYIREHPQANISARDTAWQDATRAEASMVLSPVLPVAITGSAMLPASEQPLHQLIEQSDTYAQEISESIILVEYAPRNELNLVPDMLYGRSTATLMELQRNVETWSYRRKEEAFQAYTCELMGPHKVPGQALESARYSWDFLTDFGIFYEITSQLTANQVQLQLLTPRHGFDVPKLIEEADLVDDYEQCFSISLKLYSVLQQAGHMEDAQYAALLGHKQRWTLTCSARDLWFLHELTSHSYPGLSKFLESVFTKIAEKHPLIGSAIN